MRNVGWLRVTVRNLLCGLAIVGVAFASAATARTPSRRARSAAVVVHRSVSTPGDYGVTIVVGSPTPAANRVDLLIGTVARRAVTDRRHRRAKLWLKVHIAGRSLTVSAVGRRVRPMLAVVLRELDSETPTAPQSHATTTPPTPTPTPVTVTPPAPVTVTAPSAHVRPPTGVPAAPGPGSPFTKLVWSDIFAQDWANAGGSGAATRPVSNAWGFDTWGGCGNSSPQLSVYPGTANSAYLSSQGLVLPAIASGINRYTTAQLDTGGRSGESWQYGAIEASIQLPSGAGLCPAFWMLADNGTGEIDILEAPAFVSAAFGPLGAHAIFTLHANQTQQFESLVAAVWNPGQPNVYGVIWTSKSITWTVNYVPFATATAKSLGNPALWSAFTSGRFHLLIDEAVGGWPGDPPPGTIFSQPMTVQWVKVFQ